MNWMHANIADCAETEREVMRLQTRVAELEGQVEAQSLMLRGMARRSSDFRRKALLRFHGWEDHRASLQREVYRLRRATPERYSAMLRAMARRATGWRSNALHAREIGRVQGAAPLQRRVDLLTAALTDVRRTEALSAHAYDLISAVLSATPEFELNQTDKTAGRYIRRETMEPGSQTPPP